MSTRRLVPCFAGLINFFTVPQNLSPEEQRLFINTALEVDDRITKESENKNTTQFAWKKEILGESVVEAIRELCERTGYKANVGSNLDEWVVDVQFA